MADSKYLLNGIKAGDIMCWDVLTQCQNTLKVTLRDSKKVYFEYDKHSTDTKCSVLGQNNAVAVEDDPCLYVDIPNSHGIKECSYSQAIVAEGVDAGKVFSICIEDYIDNDYNALYINVCSWHKKG